VKNESYKFFRTRNIIYIQHVILNIAERPRIDFFSTDHERQGLHGCRGTNRSFG